jgi:DNA modification methylase
MREFLSITDIANKIICGDCLELLKNIPDNSIDLIITDPPYMVSQESNIGRKSLSGRNDVKLKFGDWDVFKSEADYKNFTESWFRECVRILKPKSWIYVFFSKEKIGYFPLEFAPKYGMNTRTIFIWIKTNPTPSFRKMNYLSSAEFIWVGSKGDSKIKNFLQQKEMVNYMITPNSSVYGVSGHPNEKPEILVSRFVLTSSYENEVVLDPFMGSGTTAVVCKKLNRRYIGIEKNPEYIEMAKKRLSVISESLFKK